MAKTLYIHIGTEKTGSTTIQKCLSENRTRLSENGICYLKSPGLKDSRKLATFCMNDQIMDDQIIKLGLTKIDDRKKWKDEFIKALNNELNSFTSTTSTAIISSEHFHSRLHQVSDIITLKNILAPWFDKIKICVYLRRQDQVAVGLFSTACKSGVYFEDVFPKNITSSNHFYNYENLLDKWVSVFGQENIMVRIFDQKQFYKGDLLADFFDILDIDLEELKLVMPNKKNVSLSGQTQLIISRFNKYFPSYKNDTFDSFNHSFMNELIDKFEKKYAGTKTLPPRNEALRFYKLFEKSNNNLSEKWPDQKILFDKDFSMYPENPQIVTLDVGILDALFGSLLHQMDSFNFMPKSDANSVSNKPKIELDKLRPIFSVTNKSIFKKSKLQNQITNITLNEDGVAFTSTGIDPYFILPKLKLPKTVKLMKIDISVPANTELQLFYKTSTSGAYCEENSVKKTSREGKNQIHLEIPAWEIVGLLRLDPGAVAGKYIIHNIEFVAFESSPGAALENLKSKFNKLTSLMIPGKK